MLSGIEKNTQVLKYRWPRAKTAVLIRPKKTSKFSSKIVDKIHVKNTGFDNLETKILLLIFSHFNEKELLAHVCGVCRHWYNVARNPQLWKELEFQAEKIETITMCNFLWKSQKLEILSLNDMENPATVIRQMCRCNRSLKHLKIKNCRGGNSEKICETVLRNILHSCRNLESLNLSGTQFSATRFYHELANLRHLRKLNLNRNKYLQAKDLVTIALNCRNLEDISITRPESGPNLLRITDHDAVFFFKNLSKSLKRIEFDTTGLSGPSFEAIFSCDNLEKLSLRHALFLSGEIFRNYVSKLRRLKQLRLTQACQLVSDDLIFLSEKRVFDRLNLVDISGCGRITDDGLRSLLQRCKLALTYLSLKSCKSVKDLDVVIDNCTELKYLNIAHAFGLDSSYIKNLTLKIPKLNKLVIDARNLSDSELLTLHTSLPKLNLIRSMSEFHKDESPVCLKEDVDRIECTLNK